MSHYLLFEIYVESRGCKNSESIYFSSPTPSTSYFVLANHQKTPFFLKV